MPVIDVNIKEDAGRDRETEPVTLGVPFPEGALEREGQAKILRDGDVIPCQREVTSRWPDGSVRWLLLDFLANVDADETAVYHLDYGEHIGAEPKPADAIKIKSNDESIILENGVMEVALSKNRFTVLDSVRLINDSDLIPVMESSESSGFIVMIGDEILNPEDFSVDAVQVEREGPIHAVVRGEASAAVDGKTLRHIVRLHVYLNQSFVRIEHVFVNATPRGARYSEEPTILLKKLSCSLNPSFPVKDYEISTEQSDIDRKIPGWVCLTGDKLSLTVFVKDFWQKSPKTLKASPDDLVIGLYESQQGQLMDGGEANHHEMFLNLSADGIQRFERPLLAYVDPQWYADSGVFGHIGGPHGKYDKIVDRMIDAVMSAREEKKEYGFRHYGDWDYSSRYERGWGNLEYDTTHGYLMHFARTGVVGSKKKCWDYARSTLLHYREVDIIHAATDERVLGAPVVHTTDHRCGGVTPSHTWLQGLLEHYYMTGDVRSYEKAIGVGEYLLKSAYSFKGGNTSPREPGWRLIGLTAIYEATLDQRYMDGASFVVKLTLQSQRDNGAWVYPHSESPYKPYYLGGKAFMVGILLTGLSMYHKLTGDKDVAEAIVRGARWLINESWCVEKRAFKYIQCAFSKSFSSGVRMIRGIDYAYRICGYEELKVMSQEVCHAWFSGFAATSGFSGRRMAEPLREAPYFLHLIR